MEIIWHILLTACLGSDCRTQDVQWFDTQTECEVTKGLYEQIPSTPDVDIEVESIDQLKNVL